MRGSGRTVLTTRDGPGVCSTTGRNLQLFRVDHDVPRTGLRKSGVVGDGCAQRAYRGDGRRKRGIARR